MGPTSKRLLRTVSMPLVYSGLTLLVFWYLWTPIAGAAQTWKYDPLHSYWGDLAYQVNTLRQGFFALWNPYGRAGFPLAGDPQPGLLYPPHWLFVLYGVLAGNVEPWLIEVMVIVHWVFGAVGLHLLLRRHRVAEPACYVGGILFAFTCPAMHFGGSTLNWSYAWIPWVLVATHAFAARPSLRRSVVLGSTVAMVLLAGAPAMVLYMLILAVPYGLALIWNKRREAWLPVILAAVVATLWVAPVILSNLEQLPESVRDERNLGFITHSQFEPVHLISPLMPRVGSRNIFYGLLPLCCIAIAVAKRPRSTITIFVGSAIAAALLALGHNADYLASIASAFPPFGLFRRAHRFLYATSAAVAVAGGLGVGFVLALREWHERESLARAATWVCGAITTVFAIGWVVAIAGDGPLAAGKNEGFAWATLSAGVSTYLVRALLLCQGKRRQAYAWLGVVLLMIALWGANAHVPRPFLTRKHKVAGMEELTGLSGIRELTYRIYDQDCLKYRPGSRLLVRDMSGYEGDPLGLSRYEAFMRAAASDTRFLGHANVRYVFDDGHRRRIRTRAGPGIKRLRTHLYELEHVAPAAMYVPRPVHVANEREALRMLRRIQPGQGAVVEAEAPSGPANAETRAGRWLYFEPNRIGVEIETPGPGLVVIAESIYPSWQATLNGKPVPIVAANALFRGIVVPSAGKHRIEMAFRPRRFWGALPGYGGAFALLCISIAPFRRRRSDKRSTSVDP